MKQLFFTIIFHLVFVASIAAQSSNMWPDSVIYVTPEDEVLMRDKQARTLLKIGSDLAFEAKVSKALSLNVELLPNFLTHEDNFGLGYGVGARYYYKMADRIRSGHQADNLSGRYITANIGQSFNFSSLPDTSSFEAGWGASIGIGNQQRYLENEYFDFRLDLDYLSVADDDVLFSSETFSLRTKSAYGFVFGKKHEVDKSKICPLIKCYEDRKLAIKINRNNLFSLSRAEFASGNVNWNLRLRPRVGFEYKLGNSAFSVEQDISTLLHFSTMQGTQSDFGLSSYKLSYTAGFRYYYRMKKKVLAGESGNNLNGSYCYTNFQHLYNYDRDPAERYKNGSLLLGIGNQKEIINRIYLDAKFAIGVVMYGRDSSDLAGELDFAIGYMF